MRVELLRFRDYTLVLGVGLAHLNLNHHGLCHFRGGYVSDLFIPVRVGLRCRCSGCLLGHSESPSSRRDGSAKDYLFALLFFAAIFFLGADVFLFADADFFFATALEHLFAAAAFLTAPAAASCVAVAVAPPAVLTIPLSSPA